MNNPIFKNISALMCIKCKSNEWNVEEENVSFKLCGHHYLVTDNKLIFAGNYFQEENCEIVSDGFDLFSGNEKFIKTDKLGGPRIKDLRRNLDIKGMAINLGSGKDNHEDFINVDLGDYKHVHIKADLKEVPLVSGSVELAVSNSVLEHIYDYNAVVEEAHRLLVAGGYFYLCVPNACIRHHKFDYHRWTTPGLHKLFEERFEIIDSSACRGVAHSLITYVNALMNYKIKSKKLFSISIWIWGVISHPLFWMKDDYDNEEYQAMSQTIYVLARKL